MKIIYVTLFLFIIYIPSQISCVKTKKKTLKASVTESPESTTSHPAIIAIEIVDPNENSTKTKNSKRTIETALGYGYNSYDTSKPRYEIYKYSQHDIPPYKGDSSGLFKSSSNSQLNVQKSVQYTLPTVTEEVSRTSNLLKPGMTLYSSLNAEGHAGSLTSSLSQISGLEHNQAPVPVIVLRIYPDQLKDSSIQANLPQSHPFAKAINSINIQSLLDNYIKALKNQNTYTYRAPAQIPSNNNYYYTQDSYQKPAEYQTNNAQVQQYQYYQQGYPEESRNQQQQQQQQYSNYNTGVQVQEAPAKYQFSYQSPSFTKPSQKPATTASPQYYYVQPNVQSGYSTESPQYYQPAQQVEYSSRQSTPQVQQYYTTSDQQYPQYYQTAEETQYVPKSEKLLTAENYPTDKHTKVVFRTKTGNVRTPEQEETPVKEIKTIKIQVPDNIAKVEVQETERPYYNYQQSYIDNQQDVDQSADIYDQGQGGYANQDSVQQNYYKTEDDPAGINYNYQNIDYEQMLKYFSKRGAMPSYFFQQPDDAEGNDQMVPNDDMIAAYEDAAFPSTTAEPQKKKPKSKKRT